MTNPMDLLSEEDLDRLRNVITKFKSGFQCPLCEKMLCKAVTTRCVHSFCHQCLDDFFKKQSKVRGMQCPVCDAPLKRRGFKDDLAIQKVVEDSKQILKAIELDLKVSVATLLKGRPKTFREANCPSTENVVKKPQSIVDSSSISQDDPHKKTPVKRKPDKVNSGLRNMPCNAQASPQPSVTLVPLPGHVVSANEESDGDMVSVSQPHKVKLDDKQKKINTNGKQQNKQENLKDNLLRKRGRPRKYDESGNLNYKQANLSDSVSKSKENNYSLSPRKQKIKNNSSTLTELINSSESDDFTTQRIVGDDDQSVCIGLSNSLASVKAQQTLNKMVNKLEAELSSNQENRCSKGSEDVTTINVDVFDSFSEKVPEGSFAFQRSNTIESSAGRVKFFKLAPLYGTMENRRGKVPFIKKGDLSRSEKMDIKTNFAQENVGTQTSFSQNSTIPQKNICDSSVNLSITSPVSDCKSRQTGSKYLSENFLFDTEKINTPPCLSPTRADSICDADTVVLSQPLLGRDNIDSDAVILSSQLTAMGQSVKENPSKTEAESREKNSKHASLNGDHTPSSFQKRKREKTIESDSSDSDPDVFSKTRNRKKKNRALSDDEGSSTGLGEIGTLDWSVRSSDRMVDMLTAKIKADHKIGVNDDNPCGVQTSAKSDECVAISSDEDSSPVKRTNRTPLPSMTPKDIFDELDEQSQGTRTEADSDDDIVMGTPVRNNTESRSEQSDDFVLSSQLSSAAEKSKSKSFRVNSVLTSGNAKQTEIVSPKNIENTSAINAIAKLNQISLQTAGAGTSPRMKKLSSVCSGTRTSPRKKKLSFVCSGLAPTFVSMVENLAKVFNAGFSNAFDPEVTSHLIVRTNPNGTTDKTLKYLQAIAAKKWILSIDWVTQSMDANKLLPEEQFEVLDCSGEPGPRRSRTSKEKLFKGFEFCCVKPCKDVAQKELERMLVQCGAKVVKHPSELRVSSKSHSLPLILAQWDENGDEKIYNDLIENYCAAVVEYDWVLECLGKFSLTSFWNLLMCDIGEEQLRVMGYPAYMIMEPPDTQSS